MESQESRNLRDFLEEREKELVERLAERKRRLIPFEAELAEIRKAKNALGADAPNAPVLLTMNQLRLYLGSREHELKEAIQEIISAGSDDDIDNEYAEIQKVKASIGLAPSKVLRAGDRFGGRFAEWDTVPEAVGIPYQSMTIGQLVLRALKDHFKNGATIGHLVEFFRDTWGREIDRPSLSPQLTRLYKRYAVGRIPSLPGWFYIAPSASEGGRCPFRNRLTGEINWMLPSQAKEEDEMLVTNATHPLGADEES